MERHCDVCGRTFTAGRSDARYCSGRCRTLEYRRRNAPDPIPERRRPPLRDGIRAAALDLDKIVRRWQRLAADDRMPRYRDDLLRYRNDVERARDALDAILSAWPLPVTKQS